MRIKNHCLMLGQDYIDYGKIEFGLFDSQVACALSVGADKTSPSMKFKANKKYPNEDALLAMRIENGLIFAVADAHFGHWASHTLLHNLSLELKSAKNSAEIYTSLESIADRTFDLDQYSETTLVVVAVNTQTNEGFGVSYGDSSALILNADSVTQLIEKNSNYVSPNQPISFESQFACEFQFTLQDKDMLVLFTDGVDECHYGHPDTSVNLNHIQKLFIDSPHNSHLFTQNLARLALQGVDGNPGGQDNLAIISYLAQSDQIRP